MKNFIIAVCLLLVAISLTVANSLAVRHSIQTLTDLADRNDTVALHDELARLEPFLALTVNHLILEKVQDAAAEMHVYAESDEPGTKTEYLAAKARFLSGCTEISEGEMFSISNIF